MSPVRRRATDRVERGTAAGDREGGMKNLAAEPVHVRPEGPRNLLANPELRRVMRRLRRAAGSGSRADARQGLSLSRALRELRIGSKQPER